MRTYWPRPRRRLLLPQAYRPQRDLIVLPYIEPLGPVKRAALIVWSILCLTAVGLAITLNY